MKIRVEKMIKEKRIKNIKEYVTKNQSASLDELVTVFDVSKNTIRRDVQELVERGELKKVYGGVSIIQKNLESFHDRKIRNQQQKQMIAKAAANFVENGDVIFLDSGTTTYEMIEFLKNKSLTVITNNLDFIIQALPYDNLNIISTGGTLERKTKSFGSLKNMEILKPYNITKAFMASTGISISNGVTNASPMETELKETIVQRASEVYLLVDHDKIDKYSLMTYCELSAIDYLITDAELNTTYKEYAYKNNIEVITVE